MEKYTIPQIKKIADSFWYSYFLYEGKEYRFWEDYNEIEDHEERQIWFEEFCKSLLKELKDGWNPNSVPGNDVDSLIFGFFKEDELLEKVFKLSEDNKKLKLDSQHPDIFFKNGFMLFEYILNEYIKPKNTTGRYEDISYYYRRLFEDGFIHQKPEPFRLWFINEYEEEFTKIKMKYLVDHKDRQIHYSNALNWFKLQNL